MDGSLRPTCRQQRGYIFVGNKIFLEMPSLVTFATLLMVSQPARSLFHPLSEWRSTLLSAGAPANVYSEEHHGGILPRTVLASGIGGIAMLLVDSEIRYRNDSHGDDDDGGGGGPYLHGGAAKEVWEGVRRYTGIRVAITKMASTWESQTVRRHHHIISWKPTVVLLQQNDTLVRFLAAGSVDVGINLMAHCCNR